ncbi:hypothetical protein [Gottfriedia solisilvae]|uniref:Uncharacterized protein n=1 Tax=Gottfriedia solisilvae TaxID=1516104 RepID=A0A8J3AEP1_9BACI|nr:hypothetical protein [Gottfriedia solisilvae]GGI12943.1 hypothetical protein GCM10007380_15440 [Gottfriedia solisilvae]
MKDIFMLVMFVVITIYILFKNRNLLKELTILQIIGLLISYIITAGLAFVCIYYGGNWLAGFFSSFILRIIIKIIVIYTVLAVCVNILNKVTTKVTKGISKN